ncbi:MAG: hypothetical protein IBJ11_07010 [Phycisphaerales bacterium]|nr:hypothetical protein [Phycisphaerales bacterium]
MKGPRMDKQNAIKVIIAVLCLAVAGAVVAWNFGLFGPSRPKGADNTAQTGATGSTGGTVRQASDGSSEMGTRIRKPAN